MKRIHRDTAKKKGWKVGVADCCWQSWHRSSWNEWEWDRWSKIGPRYMASLFLLASDTNKIHDVEDRPPSPTYHQWSDLDATESQELENLAWEIPEIRGRYRSNSHTRCCLYHVWYELWSPVAFLTSVYVSLFQHTLQTMSWIHWEGEDSTW